MKPYLGNSSIGKSTIGFGRDKLTCDPGLLGGLLNSLTSNPVGKSMHRTSGTDVGAERGSLESNNGNPSLLNKYGE